MRKRTERKSERDARATSNDVLVSCADSVAEEEGDGDSSNIRSGSRSSIPLSGRSNISSSSRPKVPSNDRSDLPLSSRSNIPSSGQSNLPSSGRSNIPAKGRSNIPSIDEPRQAGRKRQHTDTPCSRKKASFVNKGLSEGRPVRSSPIGSHSGYQQMS